jgi:hypothetical protein
VFASSGDHLKVASSFEAALKTGNPDPDMSNLWESLYNILQ